jgi:hypothetical protein
MSNTLEEGVRPKEPDLEPANNQKYYLRIAGDDSLFLRESFYEIDLNRRKTWFCPPLSLS